MTLKDALCSTILQFYDPQPTLLEITLKRQENTWILVIIPFSKSEKGWPIYAIPQPLLHLIPEESVSGQVQPVLKSKLNHEVHSKMNPKQNECH